MRHFKCRSLATLGMTPLLLGLPTVALSQPDVRVRELDAFVARAVKDWGAPGLAISVVKDGRVIFA